MSAPPAPLQAPSASPHQRVTDWRMWVACTAMMLCSWLSYMDRQLLAVLAPTILSDTGLNAQTYGEIVSAFSIAYMIANPLWGSVLDYVGVRMGMMAAVAIWTAASTAHAWMGGFLGFASARAVLGLGEGATFPGGFRTAMESLPPDRQSRGIAIAYSGGSLGAIIAPILVVPVAAAFGWRAAFLATGALGALWLVMWMSVSRPPYLSRPARPPTRMASLNPLERRFWALVASYSLGSVAIGPVLYLSPLYLNRVLGFSQADLGKVLWIPPLGWEIGYFVWGWIFDRYAAEKDRPVFLFLLLAGLAIPFGLTGRAGSSAQVLLLLFWCMFVTGGFQMLGLRTGARAYPADRIASVAGVASGAWAAEAAFILPLTGRWFDQQRFDLIFWFVALTPLIGVTLWMWLSRGTGKANSPPEAAPLAATAS
jgi:ACS family hexuronate transporter-like MFS transporter